MSEEVLIKMYTMYLILKWKTLPMYIKKKKNFIVIE